jgi:hypothetical protein
MTIAINRRLLWSQSSPPTELRTGFDYLRQKYAGVRIDAITELSGAALWNCAAGRSKKNERNQICSYFRFTNRKMLDRKMSLPCLF